MCVQIQCICVYRYSVYVCTDTVYMCAQIQCISVYRYSVYVCTDTVYMCAQIQCICVYRYSVYVCTDTVYVCVQIQYTWCAMHSFPKLLSMYVCMYVYLMNIIYSPILLHPFPGIMGAPYTVLHSVIAMVAPQGETLSFASLGPTPSSECSPQLKELAYCLLYNLCCHSDLAGPTLRYLRHNFNFFCVHLKSMPFQHPYSATARRDMEETMSAHGESLDQNESAVIRQEAWFLRTLAIELRITAQKRYFSQTHQILSLLLAESSSANQSAAEGLEQGDSDGALYGPLGGSALGSDQKCISTLLSKVNFSELNFSSQLQLQHFEMALIQQVRISYKCVCVCVYCVCVVCVCVCACGHAYVRAKVT